MRLAVYGTVSTTLACWVVFSAFTQRVNYYAACVHLAKSNLCMMILLNMGFFVAILTGKLMQAIFFGQLRAIEVEHLYERSWYAVSETCLAMTIFRDEFNLHFVVLFTMLLFLKIFHWLCHDRVEFMEQAPNDRLLFHLRMAHLMTVLFVIDYYLASSGIYSIWEKKPSMMIMFGFEYTIMFCNLISIIAKYILNTIDWQSEEPWEGKSMYVFFIDLITDFMKLVAYVGFFVIICIYYQLPLHIVRDVYVTFRSFVQKCRDLYRYRRATRNMDQLYPNATAQDLAQSSDSTCIICREDMHAHAPDADANGDDAAAAPPPPHHGQHQQNYDQPKKLPCGHIFHFHCLRSWLERQQTCPTCRRSVLGDTPAPTPTPAAAPPQAPPAAAPQQVPQQPLQQAPQQPHHPPFQAHQQPQQPQHPQQPLHQPRVWMPPATGLTDANSTSGTAATAAGTPTPLSMGGGSSSSSSVATSSSSSTMFPLQAGHWPAGMSVPPAIPGLIPLAPVDFRANLPHLQLLEQHSAGTAEAPQLTREQLDALSIETRQAMEERLRVLDTVQRQIFDSMQFLSRAISMLPAPQPQNDLVQHQSDQNDQPQEQNQENLDKSAQLAHLAVPSSSSPSSSASDGTQRPVPPPITTTTTTTTTNNTPFEPLSSSDDEILRHCSPSAPESPDTELVSRKDKGKMRVMDDSEL